MKTVSYECEHCGQVMEAKKNAIWHIIRYHMAEEQAPFHCGVCRYKFPSTSKLVAHFQTAFRRNSIEMSGVKEEGCPKDSQFFRKADHPYKIIMTTPNQKGDLKEIAERENERKTKEVEDRENEKKTKEKKKSEDRENEKRTKEMKKTDDRENDKSKDSKETVSEKNNKDNAVENVVEKMVDLTSEPLETGSQGDFLEVHASREMAQVLDLSLPKPLAAHVTPGPETIVRVRFDVYGDRDSDTSMESDCSEPEPSPAINSVPQVMRSFPLLDM